MNRFLFVFGYESPEERHSNEKHGTDFESSNAVWVRAASEEEAMLKGREFANEFVAKRYREERARGASQWSEQKFACWISKNPAVEFEGADLESLDEI
jgi:hypothetical protein